MSGGGCVSYPSDICMNSLQSEQSEGSLACLSLRSVAMLLHTPCSKRSHNTVALRDGTDRC